MIQLEAAPVVEASSSNDVRLKDESRETKEMKREQPLTPTSRSFRAVRSGGSETASGETIARSLETIAGTPNSLKTDLQKGFKGVATETHKEVLNLKMISSSVDNDILDPIKALTGSTMQSVKGDETCVARFDRHKGKSFDRSSRIAPLRRHTSPLTQNDGRTMSSKRTIDSLVATESSPCQIPSHLNFSSPRYHRANSTADIQKLRLNPAKSTFDDEISRMRNSIIMKRNIKKQKRKEFYDDETTPVGNRITEGHQNFVMAYNMLTGIRVAVSRCSGVMKKINDEDFKTTKKLTFNMDGNELTPSSKYDFKFKDYCPEVFRELRAVFGIDPADYLISITGKYILSELGSPGKSGSFFYYSRDFRFIIKTIHHSEHKQLRRILKDYYSHVKSNPNTLISQFYGLHRLKVKGGMKKVHFIVMNNLFPPHRDIHYKYDLKGSTWGRFTKVPSDELKKSDLSHITFKDLNWLERKDGICFGPQKRKIFLKQLEADVEFLKRINAMDYSLLLGIHDVLKGNSNTISKLSVFDPKSNNKSDLIKTNPRDIDRYADLPASNFPGRSKYIFYGHDGGIRGTNEHDEPMRVIYYMGIIDCLTSYSIKKRIETVWRSIGHNRSSISAVPASEYGERFLHFIEKSVR